MSLLEITLIDVTSLFEITLIDSLFEITRVDFTF